MTAAQAPPRCEHVFASEHRPGHLLYWVRQCMACGEADWDDLDRQVRALPRRRLAWLALRPARRPA